MASIQQINDSLIRLGNVNFNFYERVTKANARILQKAYAETYKQLDKEIAALYAKYDELTFAELFRYNRIVKIQKELSGIVAQLLPGTNAQITKANTQATKIGYFGYGWELEVSTGFSFGFAQLSAEALAAATTQTTSLINWKDSNRNNIARYAIDVKNTVIRGISQGWSYHKTTNALKDATKSASYKADRIIRTETHRAYEAAQLSSFQKAKAAGEKLGIPVKRFWIATIDDRTRSCHITADGKFEDKKGLFHVCGARGPGPGLFGSPRIDINCRCTTGTKIGDKMPKTRRIQIEDRNTEYVTFKKYLKNKKIRFAA